MSCVYGLFSTKEPDRIRYIGISKYENADKRFAAHLSSARNGNKVKHLPVYKWINRHESDGFSIGYVILESGLSWDEACVLEASHISDYRVKDSSLLNVTDGGDGFVGGSHTSESIEKIRAYWTPEKRAAQRDRTMSRPKHVFTEEQIRLMSEKAKGRHQSLRDSGLVWGMDVGPKDKTPKEVKDRILAERRSGTSFGKIAAGLNKDSVPTSNGGKWYPTSVKNIYDRLS